MATLRRFAADQSSAPFATNWGPNFTLFITRTIFGPGVRHWLSNPQFCAGKLFTLFTALAVSPVFGQTNYGTISFTNSAGHVVLNAEVTSIRTTGLIYQTRGEIGMVKFTDLSEQQRIHFGFDPVKAAAVEQTKARQEAAYHAQLVAASAKAALDQERRSIEETKMCVEGKVLQRIPEGMLVDSASERRRELDIGGRNDLVIFYADGKFQIYEGTCLLTDSDSSMITDGDVIKAMVYPNGIYTYTTVRGGSKTVRAFTCDVRKVSHAASPDEMKILKTARRGF